MTAEEIAAGLTAREVAATCAMKTYSETDTPCLNAKHLADKMGSDWTPDEARLAARGLVKLGLAVCENGLTTSDGDFYGSGWCLTFLGMQVRAILESNHDRA